MRAHVILVACYEPAALARRSAREPDALFLDVGSNCAARDGAICKAPNARVIRVLGALFCAPGVLSTAELVEVLFGDDPHGGPDTADSCVAVSIAYARSLGACLGIVITCNYGRGWSARLQERRAA